MNQILIIRDSFIQTYRKLSFLLNPLFRFLLAFVIFTVLQSEVGYFEELSRAEVIAIFSLICAFFPLGSISLFGGIFLLADMSEVSYIMAAVGACMLLTIFLLYYGFKPGTGIVMALVPLLFHFKLVFLLPVILGLNAGIFSAVAAVFGVFGWHLIVYFRDHAAGLQSVGIDELVSTVTGLCRGILLDKYMIAVMAAFVLSIVVVSLLSRSSMNYSWIAAVVAGIAVEAVIILYADLRFGGSALTDLLWMIVALALALVYVLVFYAVDYSGTERLEFEDDDYYYYVKAVPKMKSDS